MSGKVELICFVASVIFLSLSGILAMRVFSEPFFSQD